MTRIFIVYILFSIAPYTSKAQLCKENFLGSKTLYQSQQEKYSTVPKGYAPVFINHVGRHGSRHLTKDVNSSFIYQLVLQADSLNQLSATGKLLAAKILALEKIEKKNFKSISIQGKNEQEGIADRMYSNNKPVFNKPVINVAYTKEVRTLQTSEAFLSQLKNVITNAPIAKKINDTTLRFYDLSPAYENFKDNGDWITYLQQLKTALHYQQLSSTITQQFFRPAFFNNLNEDSRDKFTADLYGFITIFYSIEKEITNAGYALNDVDMRPFLTCTQLAILANIDNAEDFLEKGPGTNAYGIQIKIALPLLADFIKTTDDYIKTNAVHVQLRFAHAETISPFATLLAFTTAITATKKPTAIIKSWHADKIIPLSSNIQWIFYKKEGSKNYLVKFLLNEKETAIKGLTTKTFPYYNWNEVRAFYIKKMQQFNTNLDTDYLQYLKDVK